VAAVSSLALVPAGLPAWLRRLLFFGLTAASTGYATWLMAAVLGTNRLSWAELGILGVFALCFGWIALSFWAAMIGFVLALTRRDPVTLGREAAPDGALPALGCRTAIVMPIHNEDPRRVFAGVAATYRSLEATGRLDAFDVFILSDTRDPDIAVAEEAAWHEACLRLDAQGRLFYRRRTENSGRKAGNVAQWVRRWGGAYEAMIVLDADSVMSGDTLVRLAALMEANPKAGIIQTLAVAANRETLFARVLQFSGRLYGPLLALGHAFWQLGDANYYGHNAIIRTRAFAAHCGLPKLSGRPPLGGEILSHDFVEAACIRRGRWQVWMMPQLGGSFEEMPSNVIDYAARDRRWAQGNLQHARVLAAPGLHWTSRLHLALGILAYVASPLWLLLLLLSTVVVIEQSLTGHAYFQDGYALFPIWPEYRPTESLMLLGATATILFLPKLLALALALARRPQRRAHGGTAALIGSALGELVFSMLLAPLMMLFHTRFVLTILAGRAVGWGAQPRGDHGLPWSAAAARLVGHTLIGLAWGGLVLWLASDFFLWLAPVVVGLVVAVPLTVLSSREGAGRLARRLCLFCTPEEVATPEPLRALRLESARLDAVALPARGDMRADEAAGALHLALSPSAARAAIAAPAARERRGAPPPVQLASYTEVR